MGKLDRWVRTKDGAIGIDRSSEMLRLARVKLEAAGIAERGLIEQIRTSQDEAMAVVADMANAIRDGKLGGSMRKSPRV